MRLHRLYYACCTAAAGAVMACMGLLPLGCGGSGDLALLEQAWVYSEANNFDLAHFLARTYVLRHPQSAAAHYLLGRCYANRPVPELTRAKGEFDMAAFLIQDPRHLDVPDTEMTVDAFRATLHYETALVLVRTAVEARKAGIPPRATTGVLNTALEHVREGLHLAPHSDRLASLEQHLMDTLKHIRGNDSPSTPPVKQRFI